MRLEDKLANRWTFLLTIVVLGALCRPMDAGQGVSGDEELEAAPAVASSDDGTPSSTETQEARPAPALVDETDISDRLIYSVNRTPERVFDTARAAQVITIDDIWRRNARTLPELLMQEAGVFVQQTNYGGGSPIIRGLMGKQIQIMIDGVRINTSTYRFGPLQYLATIDLGMVDRVEIVRGVGSVLGSDALGGVINVITKKGPAAGRNKALGVGLNTRFSSADSSGAGRLETYGSGEKFRYLGGVTYRSTGDLTAGGDIGEQAATGYDERAGNISFEYFPTFDKTVSFSYQDLRQDDVPRTDRVLNGSNLVFDFEPQDLQLMRLAYRDMTARGWTDFLQVTGYWNRQTEGRREVRSSAPDVERNLFDQQRIYGVNLELGSFIGTSHRLVYGVDYSTETIDSERTDLNTATGKLSNKRGQFTDGAGYDIFALYLQDRFDVGQRWAFTLGARYSRFAARGSEESSLGTLDLTSDTDALTGAASAVFHLAPNVNLVGNVVRGFRAPNIDDLSIFDERSNGTEVPNPNLEPERITTFEGGIKLGDSRLSGSAYLYHSRLSDLLVRTDGLVNGLPFFDLDGNGVQGGNEPNVLQKQNLGESTVNGVELESMFRMTPEWRVYGNVTWTRGIDTLADEPMRRIPPTFGTLGLRWSSRSTRLPWFEVLYQFATEQTRLSAGDVSDDRIGPDGTPGFNVFNVRTGLTVGQAFRFTVAVENLFDEAYKYHSSGVYRPGRQLVVGVDLAF